MFKPYFLWWQFFATQYLYLFRQHTHKEQTQHQILTSLPARWARLRQKNYYVPWAPVPGSSTPIPLCWLHTSGVAEHSRRQQLHLRVHTHTHTHTQSTFGLQLGSTRTSLFSPTPISAMQLDTSWMGLSMPSPAAWGACNVLSTYIISQPTYLVRSQYLTGVFLPKD